MMLMSLPSAPVDVACYVEAHGVVTSRQDILSLPGRCWTIHAKDELNVAWAVSGRRAVDLSWRPCDYADQGFRTEVTQPWSVPDVSNVAKNPWAIGDDGIFPKVQYHWTFELTDSEKLIGDWASGVFVAQWHSERPAPIDGSPVIGFLYERSADLGVHEAYLTLTVKVLESTGQCLDGDEKVLNSHDGQAICFKRIARATVQDAKPIDVDVDIAWGDTLHPGKLKVLIDGAPLRALSPYSADALGAYSVPLKQNNMPNYFSVGLYVQSSYKGLYQRQLAKNAASINQSNFCQSSAQLSLSLTNFSFKSVRSNAQAQK